MHKLTRRLATAAVLAASATAAIAQYAPAGLGFLQAVRERDGAKVEELLGADGSTVVNFRNERGEAALHIVAARRDGTYLGYLLGKGADPNIQTKAGDTPLIVAARIGDVEAVDRLLRGRARVDLANRAGETPLIIAVQQRHTPVVKRLLEAGANADRKDNATGRSARDYASEDRRNPELLRLLESVKPAKASAVAGPKL
ncbi:MAG: Ankyrin repeat protein chloroplast-like [uncultured Sphingomonas sp.]|uniref:Ankyrin repeat protein chloroplast-like n=1 Tax=uncultured Sphingomonas sp. TaxID=158754 RepID=A0A6J4SSH3_9SPHN|nr:ankyrin repeat domain-containing protein [uncultured Sphingomonas sp.]CAA9504085.1 MAG: Ankyrin repeat protein chloroplast-like [uncultured Sphingomonas sp.]